MRHLAIPIAVAALTACGPMYKQPGQSAQGTDPQQVQGPPGANNQGWQQPASNSPNNPANAEPASQPPQEAESPRRSPPTPPATAGLSSVAAGFVDAHNRVRAKHCAPPLTWSPRLAEGAQGWADKLNAQGCKFGHMPNNKYGENLAAGTSGSLDASSTVGMWYDEVKLYKFPSGGFSMETGHFTQVVWRGTTEVGCAISQCNGNDIFVCEYNPAGNYERQYQTNVLPIGCK